MAGCGGGSGGGGRTTAWPLWGRPHLRLPWAPGGGRCCNLLHTLDLRCTPLASAHGEMLAQQLPRSLRSLRSLRLGENDADLSGLLAPPAPLPPLLRELRIGDPLYAGRCLNHPGNTLLRRGWAPAAPALGTVHRLILTHTYPCVESLAASLGGARSLRHLDLSENGLDQDDMLQLCRSMSGWGGVRALELGYNRLKDAGELLRELSSRWQRLAYLGLGGNQLDEFVPVPLPQLAELVVECNNLTLQDVRELCAGMTRGDLPRLSVLDMEDNEINIDQTHPLWRQLERSLDDFSLRCGW